MATLGRKVDANTESLAQQGKALESIERLLTYHLGITSRHTAAIEEIEKRLEFLENQP